MHPFSGQRYSVPGDVLVGYTAIMNHQLRNDCWVGVGVWEWFRYHVLSQSHVPLVRVEWSGTCQGICIRRKGMCDLNVDDRTYLVVQLAHPSWVMIRVVSVTIEMRINCAIIWIRGHTGWAEVLEFTAVSILISQAIMYLHVCGWQYWRWVDPRTVLKCQFDWCRQVPSYITRNQGH